MKDKIVKDIIKPAPDILHSLSKAMMAGCHHIMLSFHKLVKHTFSELQDEMLLWCYRNYKVYPNLFSSMKYFMTLSTYVGIYKLSKYIYSMSNFARKYGSERAKRILSLEETGSLYHTYGGGWAVVTGGTSGLGYKIVKLLLKQGFNICIIDKDAEALDMAKKKLDFKFQHTK